MFGKWFKTPRQKVYGGGALALLFLALIGSLVPDESGDVAPSEITPESSEPTGVPVNVAPTPEASGTAKAWHEYPKITDKTMVEWGQATDEVRLATAGELIAKAWTAKILTPELQASLKKPDDIRPFAEDLKTVLDKSLTESGDEPPAVSLEQSSVFVMIDLGWIPDRAE